jgi:SAM-dependent methyltransferase
LAFLSKEEETVLFLNNQVEVTEKQAKAMGGLFYELKSQAAKTEAFTEIQAQRFVLQCVLCMFAEDRGMLPNRQFSLALEACREKKESTYDVLSGLFIEMNTPGITPGGRFLGTPYFNGGLFVEIPKIELSPGQLELLVESAKEDWKSVRPSIFGNIFEASSDQERRHSLGQHFTSEPDILKVVRPTIIEPWEEQIENARTIGELEAILFALHQYRVLDPACGSGNFLYMAYNALKDLEAKILRRIQDRRKAEALKGQASFGFVTTNQFYGLDTDAFAVELARVTLMIARKVAHDRLGLTEQELPLDNLDKNIVQADALLEEWPLADAIIGNPPFLGGKNIRLNLGDQYAERIFEQYRNVKDSVDICTYWFRVAHQKVINGARAGLVGTNSIKQGKTRKACLDFIVDNGGYISNAVSSQKWSGEANVHVSIVNWKNTPVTTPMLDGVPQIKPINSSLSEKTDVRTAKQISSNKGYCFQGVIPNDNGGFEVSPKTAQDWINADNKYRNVVKKYSMGSNLTDNPMGEPSRRIIDFGALELEEAEGYTLAFDKVKQDVKPYRSNNRRAATKKYWWQYGEKRPALRRALESCSFYLTVPRVAKWSIFLRAELDWLPGDLATPVTSDDWYIFGILTSNIHREWVDAQKSTLTDRPRYTHTTCFNTFPFPQMVTTEQTEAIRQTMIELNDYRDGWMTERQKGITDLYNRYYDEPASKLCQLHRALDGQVLIAYGWSAEEDLLSNLLDLNSPGFRKDVTPLLSTPGGLRT